MKSLYIVSDSNFFLCFLCFLIRNYFVVPVPIYKSLLYIASIY